MGVEMCIRDRLDTVVQLEVYPASEKALTFRLDCPENIHPGFLGDAVRIKQCLINLTSNAIKFTPEQGTVTLTYREPVSYTHLASMGVALSPVHATEYELLFHYADQALYAAKHKGRNCYCIYDDSMDSFLSVLSEEPPYEKGTR